MIQDYQGQGETGGEDFTEERTTQVSRNITDQSIAGTTVEAPLCPVPKEDVSMNEPDPALELAYDPAILTVIAVDIDTKLAVLCGISESKVFFKYDSATVLPGAKDRLDTIATCVTTGAAKDRDLRVIGRTDPVGSDSFNKDLGMSRADAVAKYLKEAGVVKAQVETESKGEDAADENPHGWPYDRRVTLRLQD